MLLTIAMLLLCTHQYNCTFKIDGGDSIDLNYLSKTAYPDYVFTTASSRYTINFCQTLSMPCNGTRKGLIAKFGRCIHIIRDWRMPGYTRRTRSCRILHHGLLKMEGSKSRVPFSTWMRQIQQNYH